MIMLKKQKPFEQASLLSIKTRLVGLRWSLHPLEVVLTPLRSTISSATRSNQALFIHIQLPLSSQNAPSSHPSSLDPPLWLFVTARQKIYFWTRNSTKGSIKLPRHSNYQLLFLDSGVLDSDAQDLKLLRIHPTPDENYRFAHFGNIMDILEYGGYATPADIKNVAIIKHKLKTTNDDVANMLVTRSSKLCRRTHWE